MSPRRRVTPPEPEVSEKPARRPAKRAAAGRPRITHAIVETSALERELTMSEQHTDYVPQGEPSNGTVHEEPPAPAIPPAVPPASANDVRKLRCDVTITKHVGAAMGFGFLPLPVVDFVAITGVQMDLVYRLSRIYDVDFSTQAVRAVIGSLLGA